MYRPNGLYRLGDAECRGLETKLPLRGNAPTRACRTLKTGEDGDPSYEDFQTAILPSHSWICDPGARSSRSSRENQDSMPILAREPACFPEDLFSHVENQIRSTDVGWWLVYTLSRREKDLMRRLIVSNIPFFCPLIGKRTRSPSGRIQESYIPLFPNYVFLYGSVDDRRTSLTTNCVSTTVPISDQRCISLELSRINDLINTNMLITPESWLEPGMQVRVTSGPLCGQEGVLIERRGKRRLLVAVNLLQQGASVELDDCDVEQI